jgi:hypothetical protein
MPSAFVISDKKKYTSGTTRRTEKSGLLIRRNITRLTESRFGKGKGQDMNGNETKSITQIFEEIKEDMCDRFCKYPLMPTPAGKDEGWLLDDDSPCNDCPLNRL